MHRSTAHWVLAIALGYTIQAQAQQDEPFEQIQKLAPPYVGDAAPDDRFGQAIDVSGDWMIVGVQADDDYQNPTATSFQETNAGSAAIFKRSATDPSQWDLVTKLIPAAGGQLFGWAVAIDDDIAAIGARNGDAVYLYGRDVGGGENWGFIKIVQSQDLQSGDAFGSAVELQGDTLIVGAPNKPIDMVNGRAGAAYLFERNVGGVDNWGERTKLSPDPTRAGLEAFSYNFGEAVAIDGDQAAVGAPGDDEVEPNSGAVYIFDRDLNGANAWGLDDIAKPSAATALSGAGMGSSVDLAGDWLVAGAVARDIAYLFDDQSGWSFAKQIAGPFPGGESRFGQSVAIEQDILVIGDPLVGNGEPGSTGRDGLLYVYQQDEGGPDNWGSIREVISSTSLRGLEFGQDIALDAGLLVGAAPGDGDHGGSGQSGSGAAFIFDRNEGGSNNFGELTKVTLGESGAESYFGNSVAVDGNYAIVAAPEAREFGNQSGAVFIYRFSQDGWVYVTTLQPSNVDAFDNFGHMVDISGEVAIVTIDSGAFPRQAKIFERDFGGADNWGERATLILEGSNGSKSISIDGDTVAIGQWGLLNPNGDRTGAVEIFQRDQGGADNWGLLKKIGPSDVTTAVQFGWAVDLDGDRLVVGARNDDEVSNDAGAAYVFERDEGGTDNWGETQKLLPSETDAGQRFGRMVTISGDIIAVSAPLLSGPGGVYVFEPGATGWEERLLINAPVTSSFQFFGDMTQLNGETLVVSNPGWADPKQPGNAVGTAWIYQRNLGGEGNWGQLKQLLADDRRANDGFSGTRNSAYTNRGAVGFDGKTIMVGAWGVDTVNSNVGAAYVYFTDGLFSDGFETPAP